MKLKGRVWFGLWLLFALAIAAWVITRDTSGYVSARQLNDLRNRQQFLQSRKTTLEGRIRRAESRDVLQHTAEGLGLRLPADSEIVILQTPGSERR